MVNWLNPADVRAIRQQLGMTQAEISTLLGIGARTWTRWETGKSPIQRSHAVILKALQDGALPVEYLKDLAWLVNKRNPSLKPPA